MTPVFDTIVIGSGLGGLLSAVFLAGEGQRVAIIEQNKQVGGCLQTFSFDKKVFDSCVHYLGALEEGQVQHKLFRYAGIMQDLPFRKLDEDGFDRMIFGSEPESYPQAQGAGHFVEMLSRYFPDQRAALQQYVDTLGYVGDSFPLYNLRNGTGEEKDRVSHWILEEPLQHITDEKLRRVLLGNNLLYAGHRDKTPFYVHALVGKSYIDSAYRCAGGSSRIAKLLWRRLQAHGGEIFRSEQVIRLETRDGRVTRAVTASGRVFEGRQFISNVHPAITLGWLDCSLIKPVYRKRITGAENSISAFMVNIVLQPGKVPYLNHNVYWNRSTDALAAIAYEPGAWPANYALYFSEDPQHPGYADTVAILTYMHAAEFDPWRHTTNITAAPSEREPAYHAYKEQRAAQLIDVVAERYPELRSGMAAHEVATPLTFRDYMGTPEGSMYGIMADVQQPALSRIPIKTKIPNLIFTGQNIGLHGVLGVSINAVAAAGSLLGMDYLLAKIHNS